MSECSRFQSYTWAPHRPNGVPVFKRFPETVESLADCDEKFLHRRRIFKHPMFARSQRRRRKSMSKKLERKVALITGGSRGIGAAIAKRLAADGATVAITYTKGADAAESVVKEIERAGGKAIAIQADAADADASKAAVEKTVATLGRLDVLVNNAGTAIPKRFEEATLQELDRVIDINVRGTFVATQAALKHMKSGGRIIMIGSCVGERLMTP